MNQLRYILVIAGMGILSMGCSEIASAQEMIYKNQRGSIMKLELHPQEENTGKITGTFTTAVGNCKADMNVPMPISGFYNGNAISVAVNFPHCKQVVAMTGHLLEENKTLYTLWLDAAHTADPMKKDWTANITGADFYQQVKSA